MSCCSEAMRSLRVSLSCVNWGFVWNLCLPLSSRLIICHPISTCSFYFFFSLFSHLLLFHSKDSLSFEVMLEQCALTKKQQNTQLSAMVLQKMERRGKSQNSFKIDPDICIAWLPSVSKDWCDWVYSKLYVSVKHISMSNFTLHFCFGRSLVVVYLLYSINL